MAHEFQAIDAVLEKTAEATALCSMNFWIVAGGRSNRISVSAPAAMDCMRLAIMAVQLVLDPERTVRKKAEATTPAEVTGG